MLTDGNRLVDAPARVRRRIATDERLVAFIRSGEEAAFEELYERHARELLSFCVYMLGSRQDAEDALQATFASAYTSLLRDNRPIQLRPWLFAIARNDCLSILRRRRPYEQLNGEPALGPDPVRELELREELRAIVSSVRALPENERAALVLTEVHGLSQRDTGSVLGVRADQVKAYVYQARSKLVSDRHAREADCDEIREELANARGAALLRGRLRRHMRSCPECRTYAAGLSRQRRQLAALLPIAPSLALRYRALEEAIGLGASDPNGSAGVAAVGASVAGAAAEVAGGGIKALAVKIAAGLAAVGAGAGVGVSVLTTPPAIEPPAHVSGRHVSASRLTADAGPAGGLGGPEVAQRLGLDSGGRAEAELGLATSGLPEGASVTGPTSGDGLSTVEGGGELHPGATDTPTGDSVSTPKTQRTQVPEQKPDKTDEQRAAIEAERRQSRENRLRVSEVRKHERELHGPAGSSKVTPSEAEREQKKAERKQAREEKPPEGHSRAPKSEEERRIKREERLRRREERRAAEAEAPASP